MFRLAIFVITLFAFLSCSKSDKSTPPAPIPNSIDGIVIGFTASPQNITTPDKNFFVISMNNTRYRVDMNAVPQSQSNANVFFATDTILVDQSREFANLGKDAVSYNPVALNDITIRFADGRKIFGWFDLNTDFGGVFGEALISTWRNPADPAKPNQKAREDLRNFMRRYADSDGPGPGATPTYFFVEVSRM